MVDTQCFSITPIPLPRLPTDHNRFTIFTIFSEVLTAMASAIAPAPSKPISFARRSILVSEALTAMPLAMNSAPFMPVTPNTLRCLKYLLLSMCKPNCLIIFRFCELTSILRGRDSIRTDRPMPKYLNKRVNVQEKE